MNDMVKQLEEKGIRFSSGLTSDNIRKIEEIYDIKFPKSLCDFYSNWGVPSIEGEKESYFPNWADFSIENIEKIKKRINAPIEYLLEDVKDGFWLPTWGEKSEDTQKREKEFLKIAAKAPRLIPVYTHRYLPQIEGVDDPPVISAVGRDIICYGDNLQEYLQNEFLTDKPLKLSKNDTNIPFWSEIISTNK